MAKNLSRRTFLKSTSILGASSLLAGNSLLKFTTPPVFAAEGVDIAAITGTDYFRSTVAAVNMLGGMKRFVTKNARVGILINSPWRHPGSYTRPDIALAVVHMCLEAGAAEVGLFKSAGNSYWQRTPLAAQYSDEIRSLSYMGSNYREVSIPSGISLKQADVASGLLDCDVFINISIAKDHTGTRFSGTMKNMMGATSGSTNSFFHHGSGKGYGYYDDIEFLSQCIADVNLVRKPDLCLLDGTEILKTNGPGGPGRLLTPHKVFAGVDRVAMDAYGATLLGLDPKDIMMIRMAHKHGLGEMQLSRVAIHEADLPV